MRPREAYKNLNEAIRKRLPEEVLLQRYQEFAASLVNFAAEGGGRIVSARAPSGAEILWVQKDRSLVGFLPAGFLPEIAADLPACVPPEAEFAPAGIFVFGMDESAAELLPHVPALMESGFRPFFWLRKKNRYVCFDVGSLNRR